MVLVVAVGAWVTVGGRYVDVGVEEAVVDVLSLHPNQPLEHD